MAQKQEMIEVIGKNSFMGLMATKGQIPGAVGTPIDEELQAKGKLFEVVDANAEKSSFSLRISRPVSWGRVASELEGGAFAH